MADISAEIAAFKGAVYGEDVRDSLVALANKLNNEVSTNTSNIGKAFYYIGQLTSSDDLNTLGEFGVYTFVSSDLPQHVPNGYVGSARLLNIKHYTNSGTSSTTSVHSQIFIGNDRGLYYRIKIADNSNFSEWQVLNVPGSVKTEHLLDRAVTTDKIQDGAVTTNKIAIQSVDVGRLATNSVSSFKIKDNAVITSKIQDGAVTTDKIQDGAVTADKIANYTITTNKIATQSIDVGRLATNSVSSYKIQDNAVTTSKIENGAVTTDKIQNMSVTTDKLANASVYGGKIANGAITAGKIENGCISHYKLAPESVLMEKLDSNLQSILSSVVTPEQYGAIGDGVTDDTDALVLAIKTNRTILFGMHKTYSVQGLTLTNVYNAKILGNNSTLLLPYEDSNNKTILGLVHCTYVDIYDLNVTTNFGNNDSNLDISNLFDNAPYGISINNGSSCVRVINCEVSMVKDGICANDSNRILISQCRVKNVGQEPIAVRQTDGIVIEKNDLSWHTGDGILIKAYNFDRFYDIIINNNRLCYPKRSTPPSLRGSRIMGGGITVNAENTETAYLSKGIVITGNHIIGARYGIQITNVAHVTVSNNVVRVGTRVGGTNFDNGSCAYGLTLDPQWAPSDPGIIENIVFSNNVGTGGRSVFRSYTGDNDIPCDKIVFNGNVVSGIDLYTSEKAFDVQNSTIINNIVSNCNRHGDFRNCVVIGNQFLNSIYIPNSIDESDCCFSSNECIIENNIIEGTQVYVNCDSFASIRGNTFKLTHSDGLIINCDTVASYANVISNDYNKHPLTMDNINGLGVVQNIIIDYSAEIDTALYNATLAVTKANNAFGISETALESAEEALESAEEAIAAIADISEVAVPEMTSEIRGGAKLGDGLKIENGKITIDAYDNASNDIVHGSITSLTAKGLATQTQTTGKNLARPNPDVTDGNVANVVCTYLGNGIWKMVGTNNADTANARSFRMFDLGVLQAGTYCITFEMISGTSSDNLIARIGTGSSAAYYSNYTNMVTTQTKNVRTFTADGSTQYWACMQLSAHATVDGVFKLQVEAGSTPTDYEPYTGGAPSPSPDYPQEIKVARGKNLVDTSKYKPTSTTANWTDWPVDSSNVTTGITFTRLDDGSIRVSGTATANASRYFGLGQEVQAGASITITGCPASGSYEKYFIALCSSDNSNLNVLRDFGNGISGVVTKACNRIRIVITNGQTVDFTFRPQLELGSTPTPYVPYGHVGVEVQGRNLLPRATSTTNNGVTFTVNDDGSITANGTVSGSNATLLLMNNAKMQELPFIGEAVTLSLSGCPDGGGSSTYNIVANFTNNGSNANLADNGGGTTNQYDSLGVPTTSNIYIRIYGSGRTVSNLTFRPQLEVGSTAHPYQPYLNETIPVPLPSKGYAASLPDGTADVLTIDGAGKVEWENVTYFYQVTGNEQMTIGGNGARINVYGFPNLKRSSSAGVSANAYCNSFISTSDANTYEGTIVGFSIRHIDDYVSFSDGTKNMTKDTFKALILNHPVTVLYPLATPAIEQCGYIDWPSIPDGAVITCPELDALGVRYLIGNSVAEMARDWYERAKSEYEVRISALEQAVAELATA